MDTNVLIAIQARSGSMRLPRKAFALIGGKMMLDRVIDACKKSARYCNERLYDGVSARVAVVTPDGDSIADEFSSRCAVVEGPEHDVLSRYAVAYERFGRPDYLVRVTGDCPLIPSYVITKMITLATKNAYDYCSNVFEPFRTSLDGMDCEVISKRLFEWAVQSAESDFDREHVTTVIRNNPPKWARFGCVVNYFDMSDTKLSVDTEDDLQRVIEAQTKAMEKYQAAVMALGKQSVHRF